MKMAKILAWTAFFLIVAMVSAYPVSLITGDEFSAMMFQYESEFLRYRLSPNSKTVLLGPSYVNRLGTIHGIINLGFPGASKERCALILETTKKTDTVIYAVTFWNMLARMPISDELTTSPLARRKYWLDALLFQEKESAELQKSLDYIVLHITEKDIEREIEFYRSLSRAYPNLRFVIFPFAAKNAVHIEMRDNWQLENEAYLEALRASGLPIIADLSKCIPEAQFTDVCHLTNVGNSIIRSKLKLLIPIHNDRA